MAVTTTNLGVITAYGDAVAAGYTGTKAEWQALMASYATVGQQAVDAKNAAVAAKDTAVSKATEATTAANTATTKANEASASAQSIAQSASQIATNTSDISELKEDFTQMESDGVVPSAEQILTDKGVTDSVPYHYRRTGGDGADRLYDKIVGGSLAVNQLIQDGDFIDGTTWYGYNCSYSVIDGVVTITPTSSVSRIYQAKDVVLNHKYLMMAFFKGTSGEGNAMLSWYGGVNVYVPFDGNWQNVALLLNNSFQTTPNWQLHYGSNANQNSTPYQIKNAVCFDLTAMFGSTIADYIYSLKQATEGAGVAWLKAHFPKIFNAGYIPYNAGTLEHVSGLSAHKMTGFNQWDEEWENGFIDDAGQNSALATALRAKNYISVIPNTAYFVCCPKNVFVFYYGENKNFITKDTTHGNGGNLCNEAFTIPQNVHYMRFTMYDTPTYNHDICINISDPAKNGTYEPYKAHSYPLDSSLTLRGIPKLDSNNKLYFDGDTYDADGTVTHNTILRAYQSGDESLVNAITDGTNTVVYSANASTEQADPYQHLQQCDPNGTEEYVSTGIVPIGHNSFYPENLRAKVEQLPWNFANLIAPTESTFTATRNYTTGALFIVNNVLYKATSNIANGGTITPNTNCTATTLAEIISALT